MFYFLGIPLRIPFVEDKALDDVSRLEQNLVLVGLESSQHLTIQFDVFPDRSKTGCHNFVFRVAIVGTKTKVSQLVH